MYQFSAQYAIFKKFYKLSSKVHIKTIVYINSVRFTQSARIDYIDSQGHF